MSGQTTREFVRTINKDDAIRLEDSTVLVDTSEGNVTLTLPPLNTFWKSIFHVVKISSDLNIVTVEPYEGDSLIDGAAVYEIDFQFRLLEVQNTGNEWIALSGPQDANDEQAVALITESATLTRTQCNAFCDTNAAPIVLQLPAGQAKRIYRIANIGVSGNPVNVTPDGAELLLGENTVFLLLDGDVLSITYEPTVGWF